MSHVTQSDYLADNSLDCPHCNVPIEEWTEPDLVDQEMDCPHCSKKLAISVEIVHIYTARRL